jgi:hypothetical protein
MRRISVTARQADRWRGSCYGSVGRGGSWSWEFGVWLVGVSRGRSDELCQVRRASDRMSVWGEGRIAMAVERKEIAWTHKLEDALKEAQSRQRHVLVDFTAAPM